MTSAIVLLAVATLILIGLTARYAPIGTRSVLSGAHCFFLHPWFVAWAWWTLFGFHRVAIGTERKVQPGLTTGPGVAVTRAIYTSLCDPRLWFAFFVHDLGYVGKPNMDGDEGEQHPYFGATLMGELFGGEWYTFVLAHSRFLAKQLNLTPSALCIADKLAIALEPWWFYLPRVNLTGEVREYMAKSDAMNQTGAKYAGANLNLSTQRAWHRDMCNYVRKWVDEHKDGRADTWTPNTRIAATETGVHQ